MKKCMHMVIVENCGFIPHIYTQLDNYQRPNLAEIVFYHQNLQFVAKTFQKHAISDDTLFSHDFASLSLFTVMIIHVG